MSMDNNIIVYIDWIRHGFSCANAIKMQGHTGAKNILKNVLNGKLGDSRGIYASDSLLSDVGVTQAEKVNHFFIERINQYDILLCSELSRAVETAMLISKDSKVQKIYMVPYISEERSTASLSLDSDNQAKDPSIIKLDLENRFQTIDGYPLIDTFYVDKYKGTYNSKNKTNPDFKLFYDKVLPDILKNNLPGNRNIFSIGIVSHNFFIKKVFKTRYPKYLKQPIENLQINTEILVMKNKKINYELPEECKNINMFYCQIPIKLQNKIAEKPKVLEKKDVERCINLSSDSEKMEQLFEPKKGGYYDKYMKYKSKYMDLKKLHGSNNK